MTITYCDRCGAEIDGAPYHDTSITAIDLGHRPEPGGYPLQAQLKIETSKMELCAACARDRAKLMRVVVEKVRLVVQEYLALGGQATP